MTRATGPGRVDLLVLEAFEPGIAAQWGAP